MPNKTEMQECDDSNIISALSTKLTPDKHWLCFECGISLLKPAVRWMANSELWNETGESGMRVRDEISVRALESKRSPLWVRWDDFQGLSISHIMLHRIRGLCQKLSKQQKIMHFVKIESNFWKRKRGGGGYIQIITVLLLGVITITKAKSTPIQVLCTTHIWSILIRMIWSSGLGTWVSPAWRGFNSRDRTKLTGATSDQDVGLSFFWAYFCCF